MKISIIPGKGISILNTELYWGELFEVVQTKLHPRFNGFHPPPPAISANGNRYSRGVKFAEYSDSVVDHGGASGFVIQLGFDAQDRFIEFSSIWIFEVETRFGTISYCANMQETVLLLKSNQADCAEYDADSFVIKSVGVIFSKSDSADPVWNRGEIVQYVYLSEKIV